MASVYAKMTKSLRTTLRGIHNKKCILIEFLNEEDKFAIAYPAWVKGNIDMLDAELEDKEVTIYWPENVAVKLSKSMLEDLKTCKFVEKLVRIKGQGDWPTLSVQLKNLKKFGKLNISKASRKTIKQQGTSIKANKGTNKPTKEGQQGKKFKKQVVSLKSKKILGAMNRIDESDSESNHSERDSDLEMVRVADEKSSVNSSPIGTPRFNKKIRIDDPSNSFINASTPIMMNERNYELPSNGGHTSTEKKPNDELELRSTFPLHPRILKNIQKDTPDVYINGLCDNFFTPEYLVMHSATGKTTNANPTAQVRPAVDIDTVKYIHEKIEEHFGFIKKFQTRINKILSNKIAAARTNKRNEEKRNAAKRQ